MPAFTTRAAVAPGGEVYLTGATASADFPVRGTAFQMQPGGGYDAFLVALDPSGSNILYVSYLGGDGDDFANGAALDPAGNVYLTGSTRSANFPIRAGALQPSLAGGYDAFAARWSFLSGSLVAATYVEGLGELDGELVSR